MSDTLFDKFNPEMADDADDTFARARTTDPETSHAAAASVDHVRMREIRQNVLILFRTQGAMTQHDLVKRYQHRYGVLTPDSSIRTRCAELVDAGFVTDTGSKVRLPSGRMAVVWAAR